LSKGRILYVGLMAAMIAALCLVQAYAGDGNVGHHGMIRALFSM
jgi:hypothetical protein